MSSRRMIRCVFPPRILQEPLLYNLGKNFSVESINIRGAEIAEDHGWMDLEIEGDDAEIDRIIEYLTDRDVEVEQSNGVGDDR